MLGATPSPANDISVGQCFEVNKCRDSIESDQDVNECCRGIPTLKEVIHYAMYSFKSVEMTQRTLISWSFSELRLDRYRVSVKIL